MDSKQKEMLAKLLSYFFDEISWSFDELTTREQEIIGSQKDLDELRSYFLVK